MLKLSGYHVHAVRVLVLHIAVTGKIGLVVTVAREGISIEIKFLLQAARELSYLADRDGQLY